MTEQMKIRPNKQKSEAYGVKSEVKSSKLFVSLLSADRVRAFESGTKDCRFTLSTPC